MASIEHPQISVLTRPLQDQATVVASCDVELTEFELRSMQTLGVRYTVDCRVVNQDLWYEDTVMRYGPREVEPTGRSVNVVFESDPSMSELHDHVFTHDKLFAEFTLTDQETQVSEVKRSQTLSVELA
jgi:hypothetical protein